MTIQRTTRNNSPTFVTAAVVTIAVCILLAPKVRAFVLHPIGCFSKPHTHSQLSTMLKNSHRPDGMPILPPDVVQYSQVPKSGIFFTAHKIPSGLLKQHTTKKGTWGIIRVSRGKLEYQIYEPQSSVHVLDVDHLGVIEPTMLHQVKALSEDLEFVVEFWRVPGTGPVDEKREGLNE